MIQFTCSQCAFKKLPGPLVSITAHGPAQALRVRCRDAFTYTLQNYAFCFGKLIEIVHQIDQQEFLRQRLRKARLYPKSKLAAAELEVTMSLVIVDDRLVIELCRAHAQAVVGIRRRQKKLVILEERAHNFAVIGGCLAE